MKIEKEIRFMCDPIKVQSWVFNGPIKKGDWRISNIIDDSSSDSGPKGFCIKAKVLRDIDIKYNGMVLREYILPWAKERGIIRVKNI